MNKQLQQIRSLMEQTQRSMPPRDGEREADYFKRLHDAVIKVQRDDRVRRRRAARAARKRNR